MTEGSENPARDCRRGFERLDGKVTDQGRNKPQARGRNQQQGERLTELQQHTPERSDNQELFISSQDSISSRQCKGIYPSCIQYDWPSQENGSAAATTGPRRWNDNVIFNTIFNLATSHGTHFFDNRHRVVGGSKAEGGLVMIRHHADRSPAPLRPLPPLFPNDKDLDVAARAPNDNKSAERVMDGFENVDLSQDEDEEGDEVLVLVESEDLVMLEKGVHY